MYALLLLATCQHFLILLHTVHRVLGFTTTCTILEHEWKPEQLLLSVGEDPNWDIMKECLYSKKMPSYKFHCYSETHTKPLLVLEQHQPKSIQQRSLLFQSQPSLFSLFTVRALYRQNTHNINFSLCGIISLKRGRRWVDANVMHMFTYLILIH